MRAHHVRISHDFQKSPDRIFAYLSEHENLGELFGAKITRLNDGESERNGVGSRRQLRIAVLPPFEETVTESVANELIVYKITKGSPLRGHVGEMRFSSVPGGGTHFDYSIRLASPIPGVAAIVRLGLTRSISAALPDVEANA
jgi:uncharacterized protein YndB with AHSA1/START domain